MKTFDKSLLPVLYSLPLMERLSLPSRAELLPKIESGEVDHLDFRAHVYGTGRNRNPYEFRQEDLAVFASSFEGQPYLRNHDTSDIDARDGTILASALDGGAFVQDIRLTTRRGMMDYLEGKMDRFSIGWFYDDAMCSICQSSWFSADCMHWPGRKYQTSTGEKVCTLIFINPSGKETSAVNVPAVEGTRIDASLMEFKLSLLGEPQSEEGGLEPAYEEAIPDPPAQVREVYRAQLLLAVKKNPIQGETNIMNLRELQSQRFKLIEEAQSLAALADKEQRDFTGEERKRFNEIIGENGDVDQIDAKITQVTTERAALSEKALTKVSIKEAVKPEGDANPNVMKRAEYDKLSANEQMTFTRNGGRIE
jgi:hypothetical protein